MPRIPARYGHFAFAIIQSGMTSCIASGIASAPLLASGCFLRSWMTSWIVSWSLMLPIVILAAPAIRRLVHAITDAPPETGQDPTRA